MTLPAFDPERSPWLLSACAGGGTWRRQLSIDIFCPHGAQQQTRHTPLLPSIDTTDRRTPERYIDLAPGSVNKMQLGSLLTPFYPRDAMLAWVLAMALCLFVSVCVCLCVTSRTSLWNFVPNSGLRKFYFDFASAYRSSKRVSSTKVDAHSMINWTAVG